ncbi:large conductance mechanosensitive channel protein MscL [Pedobacter nutrimenti]|jgi:large conductance mechanosensitive channel|uniref:Large-conductance mechanosensitive channel n=1 Tax=Pedobacter nutrimenti TaxID=1241337 RepID=A0A318UYB8_9SPHI|nr:large conductance mechanosensitive channel protein MscL [Pedobacter nutrimenti]PYF76579.1 large conductance mechanosensitive channel [Pedobacter nutrimenti]|eukprot:gene10008-11682_t
MGFVKEFKEFAVKGSVMDLAIGVIIGGAFGKIIDSIVNDLIMPLISAVIGSVDFSNMYVVLKGTVTQGLALADAKKVPGAVVFAYGNFITVALNFFLLALAVFMLVKAINAMKRKQEAAPAAPAAPTKEEILLTEIRDVLKAK